MSLPERRRKGMLAVEVTSRCNRSCVYCYNPGRSHPSPVGPDAVPEELASLVNRVLDESGLESVQVTGGEPLLYSGLFEFLANIQKPGRRLSLVTDGSLLDESAVLELRRLGVGPVQPTLLAARREIHNGLKEADCFDATIAGITRLLGAKIPVSVSFVCTRRNYRHFRDVVDLCFSLGVRTVALSRFCHAGRGREHQDELMPDAEMIRACLDVAQEACVRLGMRVQVAISLPLCIVDRMRVPNLSFGRCALGTAAPGFTMDSTGNLRACSISPTVLGNLAQESWSDILSRASRDYFGKMAAVPQACEGCLSLDRCGGGCRESALGFYGDLTRPDPLVRPPYPVLDSGSSH